MEIDNLTIGELTKLVKALSSVSDPESIDTNIGSLTVGKFCIARCYSAGVHAGEVVAVDGENVVLKNSRRLWSWEANDGVALSGLAQCGLKSGRIDVVNPEIYLSGVCELIPCTNESQASINDA